MLILKLAWKNLVGAGLRTWINAIVLGIVLIIIVFMQGLYVGFEQNMMHARIKDEVAQGQIWNEKYDALDPLSLEDGHGPIPVEFQKYIDEKILAPVLATSASIYPKGRMQTIIVKGILADQKVIGIPTASLKENPESILMGRRMAEQLEAKKGDMLTIRWKNNKGVIDARDFVIVDIFDSEVPVVDLGQVWISLSALQNMLGLPNQASYLLAGTTINNPIPQGWINKSQGELVADTKKLIKQKKTQAMIIYALLLFIAMISILDSQVLTIFKRRKEIGLFLALGLTQYQIVWLFTIEGILYGLLASIFGAVVGTPLLGFISSHGIAMPKAVEGMGIPGANVIHPLFEIHLLFFTFIIIMTILAVVSYWPTRKIATLKPTEALRGTWT